MSVTVSMTPQYHDGSDWVDIDKPIIFTGLNVSGSSIQGIVANEYNKGTHLYDVSTASDDCVSNHMSACERVGDNTFNLYVDGSLDSSSPYTIPAEGSDLGDIEDILEQCTIRLKLQFLDGDDLPVNFYHEFARLHFSTLSSTTAVTGKELYAFEAYQYEDLIAGTPATNYEGINRTLTDDDSNDSWDDDANALPLYNGLRPDAKLILHDRGSSYEDADTSYFYLFISVKNLDNASTDAYLKFSADLST